MNHRLRGALLAAVAFLASVDLPGSPSRPSGRRETFRESVMDSSVTDPPEARPTGMCGDWPCATGRHAVTRDGHPLLVLVIRTRTSEGFGRSYCSATLLEGQKTVLTAAHCLDDDPDDIDAVDVVYYVGGVTHWRLRAASFRLHAQWNRDDQNNWPAADLALVELPERAVEPAGLHLDLLERGSFTPAHPVDVWGVQFHPGRLIPVLYRCAPSQRDLSVESSAEDAPVVPCGLLPGSSGGPLVLHGANGPSVIGVLSRYTDSGRNLFATLEALTDVDANFTRSHHLPRG